MTDQAHDVCVVGAGAAGIAAAVAAARAGARTLLVDPAAGASGIAVGSGLTTICGLYLSDGLDRPEFVNEGLAREIAEALMRVDGVDGPVVMGRVAVLPYRGASFGRVAAELIERESKLTTMWERRLKSTQLDGENIHSLTLAGPNGIETIKVGAVIDATGVGALARLAGETILEPTEPILTPAVAFALGGVSFDATYPAEAVRVGLKIGRALKSGEIEQGPASLSFNTTPESGAVSAKLNLGDIRKRIESDGHAAAKAWANARVRVLVGFLRSKVSGFADCLLPDGPFPISAREGCSIKGRYLLTVDDVLAARKCDDRVARGCWPIETWDAEGRNRNRFPPLGETYDIPADSLRSERIGNIYFAGKCMSAEPEALASARVIGTCLATGEAAGRLAAQAALNR